MILSNLCSAVQTRSLYKLLDAESSPQKILESSNDVSDMLSVSLFCLSVCQIFRGKGNQHIAKLSTCSTRDICVGVTIPQSRDHSLGHRDLNLAFFHQLKSVGVMLNNSQYLHSYKTNGNQLSGRPRKSWLTLLTGTDAITRTLKEVEEEEEDERNIVTPHSVNILCHYSFLSDRVWLNIDHHELHVSVQIQFLLWSLKVSGGFIHHIRPQNYCL